MRVCPEYIDSILWQMGFCKGTTYLFEGQQFPGHGTRENRFEIIREREHVLFDSYGWWWRIYGEPRFPVSPSWSRRSRVVVFVQGNGVFDLINAGHDQYSHVLAGLGQQV